MNLKLNIAYNKTTKKLVGYSTPKNGQSIIVTAYAVDDLEKKFQKAVSKLHRTKKQQENYHNVIEYLAGQDKREIDSMVRSSMEITPVEPLETPAERKAKSMKMTQKEREKRHKEMFQKGVTL